jgi:hypothetical protein
MARRARAWFGLLVLAAGLNVPGVAVAGNGANYILYNQKTEGRGETEFKLYNDVSTGPPGEAGYAAQLYGIEHGITDYWTAGLSIESDKISGEPFAYGAFRFENRLRLFPYGRFLNPVLFAEFEQLRPEHRYIVAVTGRTDNDEEEHGTSRDVESRLILGEDVTQRLNVAFNWVNETTFHNEWAFGYAAGVNYVLFTEAELSKLRRSGQDWRLKELVLGLELYGGLGDATLGVTLDPNVTQQYLGVNVLAQLEGNFEFGIGGAFGLTGPSEDALLRLQAGYKID